MFISGIAYFTHSLTPTAAHRSHNAHRGTPGYVWCVLRSICDIDLLYYQ